MMNKLISISIFLGAISISYSAYSEQFTIAKDPEPEQLLGSYLLKEIYKRAGHQVTFVDYPSARALIESSNGVVDGEANRIYAIGDKYPTLKRVPTPFSYAQASAFTIDKNITIKEEDWESLRNYRIGYQTGQLMLK